MYLSNKQEKALQYALEALESNAGIYLDDEEYDESVDTITDMLNSSRIYKRKLKQKRNFAKNFFGKEK